MPAVQLSVRTMASCCDMSSAYWCKDTLCLTLNDVTDVVSIGDEAERTDYGSLWYWATECIGVRSRAAKDNRLGAASKVGAKPIESGVLYTESIFKNIQQDVVIYSVERVTKIQ